MSVRLIFQNEMKKTCIENNKQLLDTKLFFTQLQIISLEVTD